MSKLALLPNIGVRLEEQLIVAGIETPEQLYALGSKAAWLKLRQMDPFVNLIRLYSLEGAIQGIRWHHLAEATKDELKSFASDYLQTKA